MKKWIFMGIVSLLLAVILPGCKKEEKPETTKAQESTSAETSEETTEERQEGMLVPGLRFVESADAKGRKGLTAQAVLLPFEWTPEGRDAEDVSEELKAQQKEGATAQRTFDSWEELKEGLGISGLRNRVEELTREEVTFTGLEVTVTADAEGVWQRIAVNARYRYEEAEIEATAILHTDAFAGQVEERWFCDGEGAELPGKTGYETNAGQVFYVMEPYQTDDHTWKTGVIWAEERVLYDVEAAAGQEDVGVAEDFRELVEKTFQADNDEIGRQLGPMPEAPAIRMSEPIEADGMRQKFLQFALKAIPVEGQGTFAEKWREDILRDYQEYSPYDSEDPGRHIAQFADWESFYAGSGLNGIEMPIEEAGIEGLTMQMLGEEVSGELEEDIAMPYGIVLTIEGNRRGEPTKYWAEATYQAGDVHVQVWAGQYTEAYRDWPETWGYMDTMEEQELTTAKGKRGYLLGDEYGDPQFARADAVFISDTAVYFVFVHGPADQKEQVQETLQKILAVY